MERRQSEKIVWVNGCFDILHEGHIALFEYASSFGSVIVGVDTDDRVKSSKGEERPINPMGVRMDNLNNLEMVDSVTSFGSDDQLRECIELNNADMIIVGSEYKGRVIGGELVEVKYFDRVGDYSTTKIINERNEDIINRRKL
jgi:D-beta-D-heptose 7-phosphate kinase/D-beta-D-heptose 1-phosphate adenosyltransferase